MMKRLKRVDKLSLLLSTLCVGLVITIVVALTSPGLQYPDDLMSLNAGIDKRTANVRAQLTFAPISTYGEIVARPLFDRSRSRPSDTGAGEVPMATELRRLTLTGVVMGPDRQVAVLADRTLKKEFRVEEGAVLGGWSVDRIEPEIVVFRQGPRTQTLRLHQDEDRSGQSATKSDEKKLLGKRM